MSLNDLSAQARRAQHVRAESFAICYATVCAVLHELSGILGAVVVSEKLTEAEWRELTGLIKAASPERIQVVLTQIGVKAGGASVVNTEVVRIVKTTDMQLTTRVASGWPFYRALLEALRAQQEV
jgi:hypothetical protein